MKRKLLFFWFVLWAALLSAEPSSTLAGTVCRHLDGYTQYYAPQYRNPALSWYLLTRAEEKAPKRNRPAWMSDPAFPAVTSSDYSNSGYDRGHNVPDSDLDYSAGTLHDIYLMTNVSPQTPALNRGPWLRLENYGRDLAMAYNRVVIVTGPCLGPGLPLMMRSPKRGAAKTINTGISVPEEFYKVFVYKDETDVLRVEAYIARQNVRQSLKKNGYADVADERKAEKVRLDDAEAEGHFTLGDMAALKKILGN
jgi:endonuclease G